MAEHKYAQLLRWIAEGKKLQWKASAGDWMSQSHEETLGEIASDMYGPGRYRLEPRTITINGREIEAPVQVDEVEESSWFIGDRGAVLPSEAYAKSYLCELAEIGRVFRSRDSAQAASDAITSLLLGKEAA